MKVSLYHNFSDFVETQEDYTELQKHKILRLFKQPLVKKTFMLSLFLLIWSLIGIILDTAFVGGGVITALMMKQLVLAAFLPAIIYFVVNTLLKFIFIKSYMKKEIKIGEALIATLPYIGSAILFGTLLKKQPLFLQVLKRYMKHTRKRGLIAACRLCFQDLSNENQTMNDTSSK